MGIQRGDVLLVLVEGVHEGGLVEDLLDFGRGDLQLDEDLSEDAVALATHHPPAAGQGLLLAERERRERPQGTCNESLPGED